ncbi:MAG: YpdA family putative bacillithiol disulfide reductase [Acidobacteriia bacterium]|nr:YpdA family putative bacillithiol disulfide reductase [Terriglobia bacterium]
MSVRDLIIVGAGPSGLSAAIAAKQRGLDYQVLEQGVLVNSIHHFPPQMVFFTTPELLEIGGLPLVSPYDKPTRVEALRYYRKVVDTYDLQIAFEETVTGVTKEAGEAGEAGGAGVEETVFAIETRSARGVRRVRHARAVIFAIGYFDHPVMLGVPGEDLPHVHHYYKEPHVHYRQRVIVVGGGNSAAEWCLELYRAGAHVTLVHRHEALKSTIKYWVRPDIENRIKEGSVVARFDSVIKEIRPTSVVVARGFQPSETEEIPADAVYLLTGYRADADLMCRAGIRLTEREAPVHDPNTFETNVPGLFVAGGAIAGVDTGTIFIENGRFHGEKIVETIARRLA